MRTRRLGSDGPELSVLGLGGWKFGGSWLYGLGQTDDTNSIATIHRAVERGVNWVDTAPVYGRGRSEEIIGRALVGHDDVLVNTKCGHHLAPDGTMTYVDNSPVAIKRECEESLRRLRRERIDLYQFHLPDPNHSVEDSWAGMLDLVEEGKVRWPGASNFTVPMLDSCEPLGHVRVTEPQYNLLHRDLELDLLAWCRRHDTGVVVYEPQQTGLLSGGFDRARLANLPDDDFRKTFVDFQEPSLSRALGLVEQIRPIAADLGVTVGEVAVAFTIANPTVTGAIVGADSPGQVDGWLGVGDLELSSGLVRRLAELATNAGFPLGQADYSSVDTRVVGMRDAH